MKAFFLQLITTTFLCLLLQFFLPWWTIAVGAAAGGVLFNNTGYASFIAGFIGVALLWLTVAASVDMATASILTDKINKLLPMNVFILTGLVGGLVGGLGALTGSLLRNRRRISK